MRLTVHGRMLKIPQREILKLLSHAVTQLASTRDPSIQIVANTLLRNPTALCPNAFFAALLVRPPQNESPTSPPECQIPLTEPCQLSLTFTLRTEMGLECVSKPVSESTSHVLTGDMAFETLAHDRVRRPSEDQWICAYLDGRSGSRPPARRPRGRPGAGARFQTSRAARARCARVLRNRSTSATRRRRRQ